MTRKARKYVILGTAFVLVLGAAVLLTGVPVSGQGTAPTPCPFGNVTSGGMMGPGGMMGGQGGMMGASNQPTSQQCAQIGNMLNMMGGSGMMGNMMMGGMMMGGMMNASPDRSGIVGPGNGMMGAWTPPLALAPAAGTPLTLDKATAIAKAYIAAWNGQTKLELGEVMQFSNHFYGEAIETDGKRGAFEFLIDPTTGTTWPEPGPNMMWNLRYSTMGAYMGISRPTNGGDKMTITPDQAVKVAQDYLDRALPSTRAEDKPLAFYGYYTLHILRDGKVTGMLSVNGYTGQVWLHHWHGDFIAMTSEQ
jgi:hypothetical protein